MSEDDPWRRAIKERVPGIGARVVETGGFRHGFDQREFGSAEVDLSGGLDGAKRYVSMGLAVGVNDVAGSNEDVLWLFGKNGIKIHGSFSCVTLNRNINFVTRRVDAPALAIMSSTRSPPTLTSIFAGVLTAPRTDACAEARLPMVITVWGGSSPDWTTLWK